MGGEVGKREKGEKVEKVTMGEAERPGLALLQGYLSRAIRVT